MLQLSAICLLGQVRPELVTFEDDFVVEEDNAAVAVELSADAEIVVFEVASVVTAIRVVG